MADTLTTIEQIKAAEFSVDGAEFADAVTKTARLAARSQGVITLAFRDQRVTVGATDYDMTSQIKVPVKGKKATALAVSSKRLSKFAKALRFGRVEIAVTNDGIKFTTGETVLTLPPIANFAPTNVADITAVDDLDMSRFSAAVRAAAPVASTDDARPILTGVLFEAGGVAVSTDSYRLVVYRQAPTNLAGLFPAAALKLADSIFDGEADVQFEQADKTLLLRSAMRAVSIRQIDGEFPKWRNLIGDLPDQTVTTVTADRKTLMASLDKVSLAADESVACRAQIEGDHVFLSVYNADVAEGFDPLPVEVDGPINLIGFNPQLLRSMLAGIDSTVLTIKVIDGIKPMFITGDDADRFQLLQMPVRL